ncbi:MAG: haloacid dehalogenase type II [Gammaproteobacteria bacterium]
MTFPTDFPHQPAPPCSPPRGAVPIRAFLFDTYGTVCDFHTPFKRALAELATRKGVTLDAGELAISWRNAYIRSVTRHVARDAPFRPLWELQREDLAALLEQHFPAPVAPDEQAALCATWRRLEPWPDAVPGLTALRRHAIVAPLSNGNTDDMIALARHAGLPWDTILGSSIARRYKPHPEVYLQSVAALNLAPAETCMVAAHQFDLHFAAGLGMQTAFVPRPAEFGGATRPAVLEPGVDYSRAAEIHAESEWTFVARDFVDLAAQYAAVAPAP